MLKGCIYSLSVTTLLLSGCVASVHEVKDYSGTLAPGDGVLVVAVDTMVPFNDLRLTRPNDTFAAIAARDLPKGRSVRFIEVPAGDYQWAKVDLSSYGYENYYVALDRNDKQRFTFTVKAGIINYPGDFVLMVDPNKLVWSQSFLYTAVGRYYIQLIDRNAMLLDDLTPDQASMIERLGLVYTGPGTDDFQRYYNSLLASHKDAP
jgi:hypothetical protein